MSAGRTIQDAFGEAARKYERLGYLMPALSPEKLTRLIEARRPTLPNMKPKPKRKGVKRVSEKEMPSGEVPEKTPERTPEEPGNLSGGEQSNGPVKG